MYYYSKMRRPTGPDASRLRRRKFSVLTHLRIPGNALPGSLSVTRGRCGKPTCHCLGGEGHEAWTLTFMHEGNKHVLRIPREWVERVRQRVQDGKEFKQAVAEIFASNALLLAIEARQRRR
jgi:hypothetical protein